MQLNKVEQPIAERIVSSGDVEDIDSLLSSNQSVDKAMLKKVSVDSDGHKTNNTVVCLNSEDFQNNFTMPFTVLINDSFDRDTFHDSIMRFMDGENGMDEKLRHKFISWYCEMFRQPQSAFYNRENLKKSIDNVSESLENLMEASEDLVPNGNVKKVQLTNLEAL